MDCSLTLHCDLSQSLASYYTRRRARVSGVGSAIDLHRVIQDLECVAGGEVCFGVFELVSLILWYTPTRPELHARRCVVNQH